MMPSIQQVLAIILLQAGMIIFPGSDWFLVLRHSSHKGIRNGTLVAIGLGMGSLCITLLAIAGLNTIFVTHPFIIEVIRYLGIIWLVWQAIITFFPKHFNKKTSVNLRLTSPLLSGFMNHVFNVEMILFYIIIISQLAQTANYPLQIITAFEMAVFTASWFVFIAQASQRIKVIERILSHPAARIIIGILFLVSAFTLFSGR